MRTWVIFALLSVIVAVAQQGEAAAVRDSAIVTALDKAVEKAEAFIEKAKDTNKENLNKIKDGFEKLESSIKEHLSFGKKPVAETPKKNNVEDAQEETVAARSFSILPVFKIPQINLDEIKERVQHLEVFYQEHLEQLKSAIKEHLSFGKKPVAASKPESAVVAEDNEVVDVPKENNEQQVQPESPVVAEDNEVVDNAENPKENDVQQVQPESPVVAEVNEVVEDVDNAEIPQENNAEDAQEEKVAARSYSILPIGRIPKIKQESVASRSFFNLPEINLDEIKERVQHLEAVYQERLEQLKSAIKEHLSFGKKPVAASKPESAVVAEDNEVVDNAEIPKENNEQQVQPESPVVAEDNEVVDNAETHKENDVQQVQVVEDVDNAEIPQENNAEDAQEEKVAARSYSILPIGRIPKIKQESVASRSFFNLPEINLDEIKERVQHLEAVYQERLEQLKSAIKEHLSFGKKPVAASKPESAVVAEDNEVVDNAEIPKENNEQQVQPESPVVAEDNEVVDDAEIPKENNVEDAPEESVAAGSLDDAHLH